MKRKKSRDPVEDFASEQFYAQLLNCVLWENGAADPDAARWFGLRRWVGEAPKNVAAFLASRGKVKADDKFVALLRAYAASAQGLKLAIEAGNVAGCVLRATELGYCLSLFKDFLSEPERDLLLKREQGYRKGGKSKRGKFKGGKLKDSVTPGEIVSAIIEILPTLEGQGPVGKAQRAVARDKGVSLSKVKYHWRRRDKKKWAKKPAS